MTGDLYELHVKLAASQGAKHTNTTRVGLDTCAGCNLIRRNQLPYGTMIRPLTGSTRVQAAQGQRVNALGEVTLTLRLSESTDTVDVDFLVVEALFVSAILGTPWINRYVWSIDPPKKSVFIQIDETKVPFRCKLSTSPSRIHNPVRASSAQTLPPFSETWVTCRSRATGLSLIRPNRRRDRLLQAKNGVKSLPPFCETFLCLVANFSDKPKTITQGQVLGEAESVNLWPEERSRESYARSWMVMIGKKQYEPVYHTSPPNKLIS
jgi:hypothetical protein